MLGKHPTPRPTGMPSRPLTRNARFCVRYSWLVRLCMPVMSSCYRGPGDALWGNYSRLVSYSRLDEGMEP